MNTRTILVVVALKLLITSESVFAEGVYVGAGVGVIQIEQHGPDYSIRDFPFVSRLFAGLEVSDTLFFEAVLYNSGTATQSGDGPEAQGDFSAIAIYATGATIVGRGHLVARLGLFARKLEIASAGNTADYRESGVAVGVGYVRDVSERFSLRGDFDTSIAEDQTLSNATIGIQYRFGH